MEKTLRLFAQLTKIDETKREVWGIATAEVVDKEGEIFDYNSSKPYFKTWSDEISKATDGRSLGNVREMHEPSAVGKLVDITFADDVKQIEVGAKIVDDVAWKKCMEGVYTGFSIGGKYEKVWRDGEFIRFTAKPVEISVVDNPCVPTAHFTAVKADGAIEVRKFAQKAVGHSPTTDKNTVAPVKKDLGTVSNLAYILQSACYIQMDTAYEAEYEADGSALPAELAAWVKEGAAILQRMTEEELNELIGAMKAVTDKLGKKGAKFSAKTKEHLAGIQKCMADAQDHLDALGKDDGMAEAAVPHITKSSAATPQIHEGETDMLDATEKAQVEKASADAAAAKAQSEDNGKKLDTVMTVLNKLAKVMTGEPDDVAKVSRTVVPVAPAITVTKEQDGARVAGHVAEAAVPELSRHEIAKLSPEEREIRFNKMAVSALQKPRPVTHTPGRGGL